MKKLSGFSLMEMMVVLLIVSIIAAATAPMINRKLMNDAIDTSPWIWTRGRNAGFNILGQNSVATIGRESAPNAAQNPRLYIDSTNHIPQLAFGNGGGRPFIFKSENGSIAIYQQHAGTEQMPDTLPTDSVVIGQGSVVRTGMRNSVAIGTGARAYRSNDVVIGSWCETSPLEASNSGIAIGNNARSWGRNSIALGQNANNFEGAFFSTAIGNNTITNGPLAIAIGYLASATGNGAIAIGSRLDGDGIAEARRSNTIANGHGNLSLGYGAVTGGATNGQSNVAIGVSAQAGTGAVIDDIPPHDSVAIGTRADATEAASVAIGRNTSAGFRSVALGMHAQAEGPSSIVIGQGAFARGDSISIGTGATTPEDDCISIGSNAQSEANSIAIGTNAINNGSNSVAIGSPMVGTRVEAGFGSVSIGSGSISEDHAVAIGSDSHARGESSTAIGSMTNAVGEHSIAIGSGHAGDEHSIAIGTGAIAGASRSVAIGNNAVADQENQIVLGTPADTVYIPGNLVVGGDVYLGVDTASRVYARLPHVNSSNQPTGAANWLFDLHHMDFGICVYNHMGNVEIPTLNRSVKSDRRLKNVGKAFNAGLEEIKKLEVFNYTFKKDPDKTPRVGVMAQDLQKIFPNAVIKGEDGFLRIRMEDMFYALVNAVKELDAKIDLLAKKQKKIDELEAKVDKLEKRLEALEKKIK